ncbi:phenylalanine--tRNA ligase subunit beta [Phreatobacter sp. AB_2022a]|uniref:phenylalanine--tRNA ligase subunit beta n=1 Tax=Phreatobacter sp. AB_2022a TaxID=3003134 RepID=UPI002287096C|nr:phenylalanine--tRNA ligase subunit beta [Phreatobacter sp. AB_2022a]MCZ0736222.1 phenylalanine--tRNA ligase subunit beta [Phreatobacter sp. AB_2022a]
MKFTLSWLKDHLDTEADLAEITETLTRIGLEVESLDDPGARLKDFTVAYVISAEQHPNADRLRVCMVDTGAGEPVQVVCGAPNARTGMKSVFSPPGTYIPGKNITLGVGTIRGVESRGMLCSAAELELSEDHDGIIDLPADAPVGQRYADYAGLSDPVIEINLTPNRPDCTSIHGIARDLAAAGLGKLKAEREPPVKGSFPNPQAIELRFAPGEEKYCPAFALRLVRGVKNGASPEWLQRRLTAIGLRPINALVDITNYITFDRGRPLHVFDAAKVKGKLVVRRSQAGETVLGLDGRIYGFTGNETVIADDNGVESIAGVMGGEHSGCDENTTDVLIESALWDPIDIARTGRNLGIITDARYRFERGVDPNYTVPGADLATRMVIDFCGGEASELTLAGEIPDTDLIINFPYAETQRLTGLDVSERESKRILESLGFMVSGNGPVVKVVPPSWRPDVHGKADLTEEIMRIAGVDRVLSVPLDRGGTVPKPVLTPLQKRTRIARRALAARGLVEAVTWSFISKAEAEMFGGGKPELALANPIAADLSDMRPTLLAGLIAAAQRNADRGYGDVALFEVGQVFSGDRPEDQKVAAAGLRRGLAKPEGIGRSWQGSAPADLFDAKADALAVLSAAGLSTGAVQVVPGAPAWFHPGRSGTLQMGPQNVFGWFGELHPAVLEALGAKGTLVAFELILDKVPAPKARPTRAKPQLSLSPFQPVSRDFAFLVDRKVRAADIVRAAQGADRQLITDATVFDVYEGKGIDPDRKSIALAVTLQPRDKTLTEAEIEAVSGKVVAEVVKKTGGSLRA